MWHAAENERDQEGSTKKNPPEEQKKESDIVLGSPFSETGNCRAALRLRQEPGQGKKQGCHKGWGKGLVRDRESATAYQAGAAQVICDEGHARRWGKVGCVTPDRDLG